MCGRFTRTSPQAVIAEEFGVTEFVAADLVPRYNIAPGQAVDAVIRDGDVRRLGSMRWGFVAPGRPGAPKPINARAETAASMPMFREAFRRRRCLIVADGFYEWRADGRTKTPYYIRLRSQRPLGFAGIWSFDGRPEAAVPTCAILTCPPNGLMAPIHDRMPVILPPAARERWLDVRAPLEELPALLAALAAEEMEAYAVSTLVNTPRNDSPLCIQPAPAVVPHP